MKIKHKIMLAVLGGIDVVYYIFSPILLATIWINLFGLNWSGYFLFVMALLTSLFRAIKIGFLKNG